MRHWQCSLSVVALLCGVACPAEDDLPEPSSSDTAAAVESSTPPAPPSATCDVAPCTVPLHFYSDDEGDAVGYVVDAADMDGDGRDEALITEPFFFGYYNQVGPRTAAHLLRFPYTEGNLHDVAFATWIDARGGPDDFGYAAALVPATHQLAVFGALPEIGFNDSPHLFDIPVDAPSAPITTAEIMASIHSTDEHLIALGQSGYAHCVGPAGVESLCLALINFRVDQNDFAGQIVVHPLPIANQTELVDDSLAQYHGDPGEEAAILAPGSDLDADGVTDLVVGALGMFAVFGRVGVLADPPVGIHRVWDIATATLNEAEPQAEFGLGVATGDLDGDGVPDIFVGAPIGAAPQAYVFRGPFAGERGADTAEWQTTPGVLDQFVGYDGAIADFDGDGLGDLAVGAPWSYYSADEPGRVLVWSHPTPGTLDLATPTYALTSGSPEPDSFGMRIAHGDFDGDGLQDLLIGAPVDPTAHVDGGSAILVFGASL